MTLVDVGVLHDGGVLRGGEWRLWMAAGDVEGDGAVLGGCEGSHWWLNLVMEESCG